MYRNLLLVCCKSIIKSGTKLIYLVVTLYWRGSEVASYESLFTADLESCCFIIGWKWKLCAREWSPESYRYRRRVTEISYPQRKSGVSWYVICKPWPRGVYAWYTTCCGGGFVGYTTRAAGLRGNQHKPLGCIMVYILSGHGSYVILCWILRRCICLI